MRWPACSAYERAVGTSPCCEQPSLAILSARRIYGRVGFHPCVMALHIRAAMVYNPRTFLDSSMVEQPAVNR